MAINYASKYSQLVDERFTKESVTAPAINNNYDFSGVKTVYVYSIPTVAMGDYKREGANRYGNPEELGDSVQELTMTKDRSFTFTIDRGNRDDQMMVKESGKALRRQISEVVIPEIDQYRLAKIAEGAAEGNEATAALSKTNAYASFLDGMAALTDKLAPLAGRVCYASTAFYKFIKQDEAFIKASELGQTVLMKGQLGEVDGVPIIVVPTSWLPANVGFVITNAAACCAPIKLADYKVHENPPGISGWLVEGRVYYDAFVLDNKKAAIYVHKTA